MVINSININKKNNYLASELNSLNTKITPTYHVGNPDPGLGQAHKYGGANYWKTHSMYCVWRSRGRVGMPLNGLTPPYLCACPKPGSGFPTSYVGVILAKILTITPITIYTTQLKFFFF
jgi:hypothetical protein